VADHTCEQCARVFESRRSARFCSKRCNQRFRNSHPDPLKECAHLGCSRRVVAKDLCGSHYNLTMYPGRERHAVYEMQCSVCGVPVMKQPR
jgi:hypothetical protein